MFFRGKIKATDVKDVTSFPPLSPLNRRIIEACTVIVPPCLLALTKDLKVRDSHRIFQLLPTATDAGYQNYCRRTSLGKPQFPLTGAD